MPRPDSAPRSFTELLQQLQRACAGERRVTLGELRETVGERSFGPLLLILGLAALTPLGVIPGLPTAFAVAVLLVAGQLVVGRRHAWLPRLITERGLSGARVEKALESALRPARAIDRLVRPRLPALTSPPAVRLVALACILVAVAIPPLELVPFGVAAPAAAITAFGLGLTARDGVLVLVALAAAGATLGLIGFVALR